MDCRDSSELQLLEVARRVRKLTQMIDSWSRAPNLDARSKYIAKDLLRDSLALQESLITIRRLQETSRMMFFMEQKHELGFIKERQAEEEEDNSVEEFDSLRFGVGIYDDIFLSLSTNGSSMHNEMKSAIRGKLNQNHITSLNQFVEFPTSSSFSLTENSKGMTDLTKIAKAPNLIVKLMGLEKIPSQVVQSVKKEQKNDENIYKQTLDSTIQSCFTIEARRTRTNGSEAPASMIMKPLPAHENKGEKQKKKKKKENLPAELSLKKEISVDQYMLKRKKAVKRMDKVSVELFPKFRTPASATHKQQRKEPIAVGVNKGRILNGKASKERREVRVNSVPLFQIKRVKEPPVKPDKKLATAKNGAQTVCFQSSTYRKNISITNVKTMAKHSTTYLMEDKKKGENTSGRSKNIKTANTKCKGVSKRPNPTHKSSNFCRNLSTSSIHGFPQLSEDSKLGYGEHIRMGSKSRKNCVTTALKEVTEPQKDIKLLLLTSPDFLTEAEELFGFDVQIYLTKSNQNGSFEEFGAKNPYKFLLFGCAMELMARKSCQLELLNHPMWGNFQQSSKLLISLEQLVEVVSDGIKELNGYYRTADLKDNLYLKLERDLSCKDMFLNALWDFGWFSWVCVEEFGAVVEEIGELLICGLVGEVFFDLVH